MLPDEASRLDNAPSFTSKKTRDKNNILETEMTDWMLSSIQKAQISKTASGTAILTSVGMSTRVALPPSSIVTEFNDSIKLAPASPVKMMPFDQFHELFRSFEGSQRQRVSSPPPSTATAASPKPGTGHSTSSAPGSNVFFAKGSVGGGAGGGVGGNVDLSDRDSQQRSNGGAIASGNINSSHSTKPGLLASQSSSHLLPQQQQQQQQRSSRRRQTDGSIGAAGAGDNYSSSGGMGGGGGEGEFGEAVDTGSLTSASAAGTGTGTGGAGAGAGGGVVPPRVKAGVMLTPLIVPSPSHMYQSSQQSQSHVASQASLEPTNLLKTLAERDSNFEAYLKIAHAQTQMDLSLYGPGGLGTAGAASTYAGDAKMRGKLNSTIQAPRKFRKINPCGQNAVHLMDSRGKESKDAKKGFVNIFVSKELPEGGGGGGDDVSTIDGGRPGTANSSVLGSDANNNNNNNNTSTKRRSKASMRLDSHVRVSEFSLNGSHRGSLNGFLFVLRIARGFVF
jgi:hypothetical protein